ncbi:cob(I)yrinic acid a,c-diamide adenosyltransferase [Tessaracoccus palaemonis]|uniref:Cob(I)yrinic acid a,c-diamide adenosyltransferase n=1 Tax=Tessaracoccus palaemonis TaxID=2829499 RepID=A0ABX8SNI1_9ACTN|nr:cob(I)yrinic acid a,c-diamide adenosyltransferase [Tessaracoccus palaemonis]QXT63977.1 cob(I)yrinic acid a,c-diamide adenosyltransferase [Tessaracoccus palaemonis]
MTRGTTPVVPDDGLTTAERRRRPVVLVNTGDGKGKTSAAMGVAMRGWAQGWDVGVYQFVKSATWRTGERDALTRLGGLSGAVTWEQMGTGWSWTRRGDGQQVEAREAAVEGWEYIREGLAEQRHRLWILDEFTYPMDWGWIDADEVAEALRARPGTQHVVITGRRCPQAIVDVADLVTEMRKIKHPFDNGQRGQAGIEW